ncbi:hypothetical protein V6O07_12140, partial [Arthrospira platensis SPKY2]
DSLFNGNFKGSELTALLLHEIGHNFYNNNNYIFNVLDIGTSVLIALEDPLETFKVESILAIGPFVAKYIKNLNPFSQSAIDIFSNGYKYYSLIDPIKDAYTIAKGIYEGTIRLIKPVINDAKLFLHPLKFIDNIICMDNEKFADNFATAYGYGPELSTGLTKKGISKNLIDIPVITQIFEIVALPTMIFDYVLDEHPNAYSRI